jgi:serine/threonine protein kinase
MSSASSLEPGAVIGGDFVLVRQLGQGGMGAVYIAEQKSTGKLRALKVMHREMAPDPTLQRRFEQEAKVGGLIKSGHVVEVIAAGVDEARGLPYLVMELLDGIDLRRHLVERGALPVAEVRAIFEQLCHGVAAAHAAGIVHRDLKPENIFLARPSRVGSLDAVVKVLDFGIAKIAADAVTSGTAAVGSPLYMAPEQTAPGPVTPAADVWALGLIAYELLTGEHFWRSAALPTATPTHLLREIVLDPIPLATERGGARLPPGFDAWFARSVARPPADRFRDAGELWRAMTSCLPDAPRAPSGPPAPVRDQPDVFAPTAVATPGDSVPPMQRSSPLHDTPLAVAPPARAPRDETPPRPPSVVATPAPTGSRRARVVGASLGLVGLLVGALFARPGVPRLPFVAGVPGIPPIPAGRVPPSHSHARSGAPRAPDPEDEDEDDESPTAEAPLLGDGYSDPNDTARPRGSVHSPTQKTIRGHRVRLLTRVLENDSNVADDVVRSAVDHSSWRYTTCYEAEAAKAHGVVDGTVTVSFDILDQLPRHAKLESSTFASDGLGQCVERTVGGQTINAAGPGGKGRVLYGFRFVVTN